ncbi:MAG: radical SAM protein [Candidatus Omnitrophica bacterium]|nr:radical SAM protein [Candidatus Omnitrophota bacterium]
MAIVEPIIRPPSEAESFLLQVTVGCSANQCTFCGAYLNKPFAIKNFEEIVLDIQRGRSLHPQTRRVFILDGDALVVNNTKLLPVLKELNDAFPMLSRISSYATGYNILKRTDKELHELYAYQLKLIYIGLESGNQDILDRCRKRSSAEEMVEAVRRAAKARIKSSVIVLLGLGGKRYSKEHVKDTITALNRMQPRYLSFLSLMVIPGTPLYEEILNGDFAELNPIELLKEAHDIISGLKLEKTIFRCNHASNYLPLKGRFPQDKERLLDSLQLALQGELKLKPEFLRGL